MSNDINKLNSSASGGGATPAVARPQTVPSAGTGAGSGTSAGSSNDVQITDTAAQLAALEQSLRDQPAVDQQRVAQVRSALAQGAYSIDPQRIADQLLSVEQTLAPLTGSSRGTPATPGGSEGG